MSWMLPRRATEATLEQLVKSGAIAGLTTDDERGFRRVGGASSGRAVPERTLEQSRAGSVAGYRINPMARAIIDTYVSFVVGDSGLTLQCSNPDVREVADRFWRDPRNQLGESTLQELLCRDHLLMGETALELLVADRSGFTRFSPIDPTRVVSVELEGGNPLWPSAINVAMPGGEPMERLDVARISDVDELRAGQVSWWPSFRALLTDRRGVPFLTPVLDWLDSYDQVLSNLVDRTALARYLVWDVSVDGDAGDLQKFIDSRGGLHAPRSGSIEAHTDKIKWEPKSAQTGGYEDTNTAASILTSIAGGSGLARTWLADPEDANRATSLSMAEPVRRRVGGVQNMWLARLTELVRFAVDQAVRAGRLPLTVKSVDAAGVEREVPSSETVRVLGPEIAAADAQVSATILASLSDALDKMVAANVLTSEAAGVAAKKAWEDYVGVPYTAELDEPDRRNVDDIATHIEESVGGDRVVDAIHHGDEVARLRSEIVRLRRGRKFEVVRDDDGSAKTLVEVAADAP